MESAFLAAITRDGMLLEGFSVGSGDNKRGRTGDLIWIKKVERQTPCAENYVDEVESKLVRKESKVSIRV